MRTVWIGVAGFAGAISRYHVSQWVSRSAATPFPWGTLVVNVSGCFLLGLLTGFFAERLMAQPHLRVAVTAGFLGGYTTFSTFAYETVDLGQQGAVSLAIVNVLASIAIGILAVWLGGLVGRAL